MKLQSNRRHFLGSAAVVAGGIAANRSLAAERVVSVDQLDQILARPVLQLEPVKEPVIIESIEMLRRGEDYFVRMRSRDGVEAYTFPNPGKIDVALPVFFKDVVPVFLGKDARDLQSLLWDVYRHRSNYKMQGLIFWVAVAAIEMGALELLARSAQRPLADLFGGTLRRDIPVYFASSNRGNSPEAEVEHFQKLIGDSGIKAIKWRAGGRMSRNADSLARRTENLIPLLRAAFGKEMTIYADANSSYDALESIRLGRMMQDNGYGFFEEPCEFDDLWGTKKVADALSMPIAGGEQEFSLHRWKWMIANRAVDIVQPDLHYGGGFIRAVQVARMAEAAGMKVVPHMSGGGLGYVEVIQFASFVPNIGDHMEFKGNANLPVEAVDSNLVCTDGIVRCPGGIGFGMTLDPDFIKAAELVRP
jgi:L-alanine-DL-glutamate epimerase-like enolase superfamily enzyme